MTLAITDLVSGRLENLETGKPVVILLHGYGSNEDDLPGLVRFLPGNLPWYSLRAPVDLGNGFFAWANRVTPGNPPSPDVELATEAIWQWVDTHLDEKSQLIVLGFSQGGLMTTQLLRTRPERVAAAVILAGFTLDAVQPADSLLATEKPKVIYCRGLQDDVISPDAVQRTLTWLKAHTTAEIHSYDGLGHSIDERVMDDVADYLKSAISL
jgi:phospholipase/carboxylesterase